jgi:hypothetical protein
VGDLGGVGAVVHEEQLDILDVVDEEALVAGGHHVPGLLVGAEADRGHNHATPEASPDTVVDTLGLAPAGIEALEPITLVTGEALRACNMSKSALLRSQSRPAAVAYFSALVSAVSIVAALHHALVIAPPMVEGIVWSFIIFSSLYRLQGADSFFWRALTLTAEGIKRSVQQRVDRRMG